MPELGCIDGNAPPFIMLAISFTILPLIFMFLQSAILKIARSRFRTNARILVLSFVIPCFFLGCALLLRIFLNGKLLPPGVISKSTFHILDFFIIVDMGLVFSTAFAVFVWYLIYLRSYRRFDYESILPPTYRKSNLIGKIDWFLPKGMTESRTHLDWQVFGDVPPIPEGRDSRRAPLIIDLKSVARKMAFKLIKRKDRKSEDD
jgi:hypothetical protein